MIISVEISYYPLVDNFKKPINDFIQQIVDNDISIESGRMSTVISGEYTIIMNLLTSVIKDLMNNYPSVFNIKISNSCVV